MKTEDSSNPLNTDSANKRNPKLMWVVGLIAIFAVLFAQTQCGFGKTEPIENKILLPSDENYPKVNLNPKQVVKFTASIPEGWPTEFTLAYSVATHQEGGKPLILSPKGCPWTQHKQFAVNMPLHVKRQGENYEGTFAVDYFEPGICEWKLHGITSPILTYWLGLLSRSDALSEQPDPKAEIKYETRHFWCAKNGKRKNRLAAENTIFDCTSFHMLSFAVDPPPGFEASIPKDQQYSYIGLNQYSKEMKVEFHDLDRAIADYVQRQNK